MHKLVAFSLLSLLTLAASQNAEVDEGEELPDTSCTVAETEEMRLRCLNCVGVDWDEEEALPRPLQCLSRGLATAHVQFKVATNPSSLLNPPPGFTVAWTVEEEVPENSTFVVSFCEVPKGLCQEAGRASSTDTNTTVPTPSDAHRKTYETKVELEAANGLRRELTAEEHTPTSPNEDDLQALATRQKVEKAKEAEQRKADLMSKTQKEAENEIDARNVQAMPVLVEWNEDRTNAAIDEALKDTIVEVFHVDPGTGEEILVTTTRGDDKQAMVPLPDGVKCGDTVTYIMRDKLRKQQLTSTSNPSEGHQQSVVIPKCDNGKAENMRIHTKLRTSQKSVHYMWPGMKRKTQPVMPVRLSIKEKESGKFIEREICRSSENCMLPKENKDTTVTYQIERMGENDSLVDEAAGGVVITSRCDVMQCKVLDIVSWNEFEEEDEYNMIEFCAMKPFHGVQCINLGIKVSRRKEIRPADEGWRYSVKAIYDPTFAGAPDFNQENIEANRFEKSLDEHITLDECKKDPVCLINYRGPPGYESSNARKVGVGQCELPEKLINSKFERGQYLMPITGNVYQKYKKIISNGVVVRRFFHSLIDFSLEPGAPSPLQYTMYNNGTEEKRVYMPFARNQGHILPARYVIEFFTNQNPDETKIVKKRKGTAHFGPLTTRKAKRFQYKQFASAMFAFGAVFYPNGRAVKQNMYKNNDNVTVLKTQVKIDHNVDYKSIATNNDNGYKERRISGWTPYEQRPRLLMPMPGSTIKSRDQGLFAFEFVNPQVPETVQHLPDAIDFYRIRIDEETNPAYENGVIDMDEWRTYNFDHYQSVSNKKNVPSILKGTVHLPYEKNETYTPYAAVIVDPLPNVMIKETFYNMPADHFKCTERSKTSQSLKCRFLSANQYRPWKGIEVLKMFSDYPADETLMVFNVYAEDNSLACYNAKMSCE